MLLSVSPVLEHLERAVANKWIFNPGLILGRVRSGRQIEWAQAKKKSFVLGPARHPNSPAAARQPIAVAQAHERHESHKQERKLYILLWSVPVLRVKSMFCDQPYQCVYAIQKYKKYDQKNNL